MKIHFHSGSAVFPLGGGNKIVAHICNNIGAWGSGFVMAISQRWPKPRREYKKMIRNGADVGDIDMVQVEPDIWVCNMIGQHDIRPIGGRPPIRYGPLSRCLQRLAVQARRLNASIHMPRIGCKRAGGKWSIVEPMILQFLNNLEVHVYDPPGHKYNK